MFERMVPSHFYALGTVFLWSSAYVFTKVALEHFTVASLGFLRSALAAAVLVAVMAWKNRPRPRAGDLPWFALSGATGFALYLLVFNKGSTALNPTTSCLILSTAPLITSLVARLCFGEALTAAGLAAMLSAFGGVAILRLGEGGSLIFSRGVFWMLLAALLISLYNIIQRKLAASRDPLTITAYSFLAGAVLLAWGAPEAIEECRRASAGYLAVVVFLGVFPSALAYLWWAKALAAASAGTVASYMYLTPLLTLLLEYLVLAGTPGLGTFVGGAVILGSLVLFNRKGRRI